MSFPPRLNGQTIEASWFNGLQDIIDKSIIWNPTKVTAANYTLADVFNLIEADSNANAVAITFPPIVAGIGGKTYAVKGTDLTNGVTIDGDGTDTIDDSATALAVENINQVFVFTADEDNSNWIIVGTAFPPASAQAFRTFTSDSDILSSDDIVLIDASSGNVTATLPAVASSNGKGFYVKSIDSTNIATIGTTDGLIDGAASLALDTGEAAYVVCDGSNWFITATAFDGTGGGGGTITSWSSDGAITIGATTTAPTKGSITVDTAFYRRVGDSMEVRFEFSAGSGAAGSGDYLFSVPASGVIDTSKMSLFATVGNVATSSIAGVCSASVGTVQTDGVVSAYSATQVRLHVTGSDGSASFKGVVGSAFAGMSAPVVYTASFTVPIIGW